MGKECTWVTNLPPFFTFKTWGDHEQMAVVCFCITIKNKSTRQKTNTLQTDLNELLFNDKRVIDTFMHFLLSLLHSCYVCYFLTLHKLLFFVPCVVSYLSPNKWRSFIRHTRTEAPKIIASSHHHHLIDHNLTKQNSYTVVCLSVIWYELRFRVPYCPFADWRGQMSFVTQILCVVKSI